MSDSNWGSDVPVSMPEALEHDEVLLNFGTHVFTASGMKINSSRAVREEIVASAYLPVEDGDG